MKRLVKTITMAILIITMLIGTTAAANAATDPLDTKLSTYAVEENQGIFDYLEEIYSEKFPDLALERMYLSKSDEEKIDAVAAKIIGSSWTDTEKFNKIIEWTEANIVYESNSEGFPMDVLYNGKANCWGYAQIITAIARSQNIPCVPASGFLGDLSWFTYNTVLDQIGHAWVYAYLDGAWRLYDPLFDVYNETDLDFISKWYKVMSIEGVYPVYEGQNLKRANAFASALYIDGKFMCYTNGIPSSQYYGDGAECFTSVNEFCYPVRPYFNGTAIGWGDIFTGWCGYDYMDEEKDPELGMSKKESLLINDQCFEGGWLDAGRFGFYIRNNGICLANSTKTHNGQSYSLTYDGTAVPLASEEFTLYNGYPTIEVGDSLSIYAPVWLDWEGYENDDGSVSTWHIVDDTPEIAHMSDDGVITAKSPGIATFYINCNYDNIALQVRVVDNIPAINLKSNVSASLSAKTYAYTGKAKKPSVTVTNAKDKVLTKDIDYTVTYPSGRKNVGTYKIVVNGKGLYNFKKTLSFKINPAKTAITSLTKGTKAFTVKWEKKIAQVTGYELQYSTTSTFKSPKTVKVKSSTTTKKTVKNLKAKKKYYVRVRTYKNVDGKTYYSAWSGKKSVITK